MLKKIALLSLARIELTTSLALQPGGSEPDKQSLSEDFDPNARDLIVADNDWQEAEDLDTVTDNEEVEDIDGGELELEFGKGAVHLSSDAACIHSENVVAPPSWTVWAKADTWQYPSDSLTALGGQFNHKTKAWVIMGVGVPKSASTFAYWTLYQHNETLPSQVKETRFFTDRMKPQGCDATNGHNADVEKYASCFYGHWMHPEKAMLEFSPQYFGQDIEKTIQNIKPVFALTEMRFIALIREPITRLESQITMHRTNGKTRGSDHQLGESYVRRVVRGAFDYGNYYDSIKQWVDAFGSRSLLVVNNDALAAVETWRRIFVHTGLRTPSEDRIKEMIQHASRVGVANHADGKYMKFNAPQTKELAEHFEPVNQKLWELLNVTAPWW